MAKSGGPKSSSVSSGCLFHLAAFIDLCCCAILIAIAVCYFKAGSLSFQTGVVAVLECIAGCVTALATMIRFGALVHHFNPVYTWFGRGLIYVLFGALGLGTGDVLRLSFSGIAIGVGLLWVIAACFMPHQPPPICCDLSGDAPHAPAAPSHGAAAPPAPAATPFSNDGANKPHNPFNDGA